MEFMELVTNFMRENREGNVAGVTVSRKGLGLRKIHVREG